jgi:hypothetical protein
LVEWRKGVRESRAKQVLQPAVVLADYMKGCSVEDLHFLLNFDKLQEWIYSLDLHAKRLTVGDSDLPWPVKFVLARFNRKHIFANGTLPDEQLVCDSVSQFARRMKWRWHFQGSEWSGPLWKFGVRTPPYNGVADSAVCAFLAKLEAEVLTATRRSLRIAKENRHVWKNQYPLISWSLKWMSSQACTVLPNDKEPGYTVVSVEDVLSIHQSILSKSCYVEVDPDLWVEGTMLK